MNAVLSAVKAWLSNVAILPRWRSGRPVPKRIALARLLTLTLLLRPAYEDRSSENSPFTKTSVCHEGCPKVKRRRSARATIPAVRPSEEILDLLVIAA